jgi:cardiolipin synthase
MLDLFTKYWPTILATLSVLMATPAVLHAAMTKRDVSSAIGWVGVILMSPFFGPLLYAFAGINRIRRATIMSRRQLQHETLRDTLAQYKVEEADIRARFGDQLAAMKVLGDRVARRALTSGNTIKVYYSGDETYAAMLTAIDTAQRSIILETYIFDRDAIGLRIADALIAAGKRGVEVRVLIDAVGARYSSPSILPYLEEGGVRVEDFNGEVIFGLRLPYANLRTHRKILVVDGEIAFVGGMNIRAAFSGPKAAHDTHFAVSGPAIADIFNVAADDWHFDTKELLDGAKWQISVGDAQPDSSTFVRTVASGPDRNMETNHKMIIGAFSVAERSIRIISPYFLPDNEFLSALATAARKGVNVDIIVPEKNNLALVGRAMMAQFDLIIRDGVRIWRAPGIFDHSKLMVIDGMWSYVGSSNLDSRSLRLNFEIDIEVIDRDFAAEIESHFDGKLRDAHAVTVETLRRRPFPVRVFDRILWLGSPYL